MSTFTRRRLLALASGGLAAQACGVLPLTAQRPVTLEDGPDALAARAVSGGVLQGVIPAIDTAFYDSAADANRVLTDDEVIDGVIFSRGSARRAVAYPRLITLWHEVVNEEVAGDPVSLTYCPLTGSTVIFSGQLSGGRRTNFETSGKLLNSNLVMVDRTTQTLWSQILGMAIAGERKGERLVELPVHVTTTWGRWKRRYPDTLALGVREGLGGRLRPYGTSPYDGYEESPQILFPVEARDDRFHPKKVVVGLRLENEALAIPKEEFLERNEIVRFVLAREPLALVPDAELGAVRVFRTRFPRFTLTFHFEGDGMVDDQTGTRWDLEGRAREGELADAQVPRLVAFDVQWFAWYAFYPRTRVLA